MSERTDTGFVKLAAVGAEVRSNEVFGTSGNEVFGTPGRDLGQHLGESSP